MAHAHHHHHSADDDAPLDAANQSLADALRASFGILKLIMFVLIVMYCFSGVRCIDESQEAVVLRFGRLLGDVRGSGRSYAFPYPIDETLVFPTKRSNTILVQSHWPKVRKGKELESLGKTRSSGGLKPGMDGCLLTADSGLIHIKWEVTYRVSNLRDYVLYVADEETDDVTDLIQTLLENAAVREVARYDAESATRGNSQNIADAVRVRINEMLDTLGTGVDVVALDIPRSSVPGQTIRAFDQVASAENEKLKEIADARQKRNEILNNAAGPAWEEFITHKDPETGKETVGLIDLLDAAKARSDQAEVDRLLAEIDDVIEHRAAGDAGKAIRRAKGFYTQVVQAVQGDIEEYETALDQYRDNRDLFLNRMWQETLRKVLQYNGVKKHFVGGRANEIRIKIGADPMQRELDEAAALQVEADKYDFTGPKRMHAVVPGMDIDHD